MKILRIAVAPTWPQEDEIAWWLLDAGRQSETLLQAGGGPSSALPEAERCELLLTGAQCGVHVLRLPPGPRKDRSKLITYALEERLCEELDALHFTVFEERGEDVCVAVVARARLATLIAACRARRLEPAAAWPAALCLAGGPEWRVWAGSSGGLLRTADGGAYAWDGEPDANPPWIIRQALREAIAAQRPPPRIVLQAEREQPASSFLGWSAALGVEVDIEPPLDFPRLPRAAHSANLLHAEFAPPPRRRRGEFPWRPALGIAAAALLVNTAAGMLRWTVNEREIGQLRETQLQVFNALFPGATAAAPALQTQRLLDDLRASHGRLRSDDFLTLTHALVEALGPRAAASVRQLDYDDGTLAATLAPSGATDADGLAAALALRGVSSTRETSGSPDGGLRLKLRRVSP